MSVIKVRPPRSVATAIFAALLTSLAPLSASAAGGNTTATNVPWYLSRATGLAAYGLLFLTVVLGLAIRTKAMDRIVARWRVTDIHIVLSVLVLAFVAVHITALLFDSFIGFSVVQLLVPFASSFATWWTGVGVLMAYLLVIVAISFPARRIIGYRAWRALHFTTFLIYLGSLAHGLVAGTDTPTVWAQAYYLVTAGLVVGFVVYRVYAWSRREQSLLARTPGLGRLEPEVTAYILRPAGLGAPGSAATLDPAETVASRTATVQVKALGYSVAAIGVAALVLLAAAAGPFHWSDDAAGTQPSADGGSTGALVAISPAGFTASYNGTYTQDTNRRATTYALHALATGDRDVTLDVQLQVSRDASGATRTIANQATLADTSGAELCAGTATALNGTGFDVSCDGGGEFAGHTLRLTGTLQLGLGGRVQGTLVVTVTSNPA